MKLWEDFESRYLIVSRDLVGDGERALPRLFIDKLKKANLSRLKIKAEAAQRSGKYSVFESEEN